jgi:hypothetical protein
MYNSETDLIFPPRAISSLLQERGTVWQDLVFTVQESDPNSIDQIAFILMLARLNNCATCNADSYRAIHGCTTCARQSLKRFHGTDDELSRMFTLAKTEVTSFIQNQTKSKKNI